MSDSYEGGNLDNTNPIEHVAGRILVVAIVVLFFVLLFVFCFHLYAKWFWFRRREPHYEITLVSAPTRGLDPIVLMAIPVVTFDPDESENGPLQCAVCLCGVSKGEKARILPKCNHSFHLDCIDMWFQSHSTCPLCRNPVADELASGYPGFPTNVLYWGEESQVSTFGPCLDEDDDSDNYNNQAFVTSSSSSSSSSMMSACDRAVSGGLVIDIPRQVNEEEEQKSPMLAKLKSLKRLLSDDNRRVNPSSPRITDLE